MSSKLLQRHVAKKSLCLKPLTDKSGTKTFVWTNEMEKAFKEMKSLMAMNCWRQ